MKSFAEYLSDYIREECGDGCVHIKYKNITMGRLHFKEDFMFLETI